MSLRTCTTHGPFLDTLSFERFEYCGASRTHQTSNNSHHLPTELQRIRPMDASGQTKAQIISAVLDFVELCETIFVRNDNGVTATSFVDLLLIDHSAWTRIQQELQPMMNMDDFRIVMNTFKRLRMLPPLQHSRRVKICDIRQMARNNIVLTVNQIVILDELIEWCSRQLPHVKTIDDLAIESTLYQENMP